MTAGRAESDVEFTGTVEAGRGGGAWVEVPAAALEALGGGTRFRVVGTLGDTPLESSTMPMGSGRVCLGLHKATRVAAGVEVGQLVRLAVRRDNRPREVAVPEDLAAALAQNDAARSAYERLAYTHRREYAEWVSGAKREETRSRRVAATIQRLVGGAADG